MNSKSSKNHTTTKSSPNLLSNNHKLRFIDRPDLAELVNQDQSLADEMLDYLEKRDEDNRD